MDTEAEIIYRLLWVAVGLVVFIPAYVLGKQAGREECEQADEKNAKTRKRENARLRAALKPVLECDCQLDNYPTKEAYMAALDNSINEAKRIYNGGGEKQKEGVVQ